MSAIATQDPIDQAIGRVYATAKPSADPIDAAIQRVYSPPAPAPAPIAQAPTFLPSPAPTSNGIYQATQPGPISPANPPTQGRTLIPDITTAEGFQATGGGNVMQPLPESGFFDNLLTGLKRGWQTSAPSRLGGNKDLAHFSQPAEGVGGFIGQTAASLPGGLVNPENAAANTLGILTGTKSVEVAAPLIERVGAAAGPRVATILTHMIGGAGGTAPVGVLERAGSITPNQWSQDPWGSLLEVAKTGGTSAGLGALLGGVSGSFGKPAESAPPRLTPEQATQHTAALDALSGGPAGTRPASPTIPQERPAPAATESPSP